MLDSGCLLGSGDVEYLVKNKVAGLRLVTCRKTLKPLRLPRFIARVSATNHG